MGGIPINKEKNTHSEKGLKSSRKVTYLRMKIYDALYWMVELWAPYMLKDI